MVEDLVAEFYLDFIAFHFGVVASGKISQNKRCIEFRLDRGPSDGVCKVIARPCPSPSAGYVAYSQSYRDIWWKQYWLFIFYIKKQTGRILWNKEA